jgi:DNA-binding response OmpR family regulator
MCSHAWIMEILQGIRDEGYERTIDLHVKNLRAKIGDGHPPRYIQSIYGVGYGLVREFEDEIHNH